MKNFFYHLFTPQESNNQRAKILHHRVLFIFLLFFLVSPFVSDRIGAKSVLGASSSISAPELSFFTNDERQKNGLSPLRQDELLAKAAENKAADMFSKNYWAHVSPDGTTPWFFIKAVGYEYVYAGENLAKGFSTSEEVVRAWMNSSTHRANLLSENYEDVGFAVSSGSLNGEETTLVVQEFGGKALVSVAQKKIPQKEEPVRVEPTEEAIAPTQSILGLPRAQSISLSQRIVILTVFTFLSVLTIDMFLAYRRKLPRLVGHNLDHLFLFLFMMILISTLIGGTVL